MEATLLGETPPVQQEAWVKPGAQASGRRTDREGDTVGSWGSPPSHHQGHREDSGQMMALKRDAKELRGGRGPEQTSKGADASQKQTAHLP